MDVSAYNTIRYTRKHTSNRFLVQNAIAYDLNIQHTMHVESHIEVSGDLVACRSVM